jgi:outer membrane protein assembly factor BamB
MKLKLWPFFFFITLGLGLDAQQIDPVPAWRHALGGAVIGVPAVQGGSVAAVCEGGSVEAYSSRGTRLWSFNARGRLSPYITRSPEGASYICRTNGRFIVINRTGRELWRLNLGSPLTAPVLVGSGGRIFITTAGRIDCYTASGFPLWSKPLTRSLALKPQPDKRGGLVTVRDDGELLILSPYGKVQTSKLREVPAMVIPLDSAAARLLAPEASKAAAVFMEAAAAEAAKHAGEAANAAVRAKEAAERAASAVAASPGDSATTATARAAAETANDAARTAEETALAAKDAAAKLPPVFDGNEQTVLVIYKNGQAESVRWYDHGESALAISFSGLGSAPLAAVCREDTIGAVMANGRVSLFSITEGRFLWSADSHINTADTAAETLLIYDERGLYALTAAGATGYGADGKQRWTIGVRGTSGPPAFSDEGLLYSGGSDWVLYAYHMEDTVRTRKQSFPAANPVPSLRETIDINRYDPIEIGERMERISAAIRKGQVGENERYYTAYLMDIAGSFTAAPLTQDPLHPLVQVNYRAEAARLLSYIGSRETVPFLANLCVKDPDPLVKAAAAGAIGVIGVDPDGTALAAFAALVFPLIPGRDERVMASIAGATGALCRFSGPPLSEAGTRLLSAIASLGPSFAQAAARKELQLLHGEAQHWSPRQQ